MTIMGQTQGGMPENQKGPAQFANTHWSLVIAAGSTDSGVARAALEALCQAYWYPLYAYVRRKGYAPHDAEDLTQGFFATLLSRNALEQVTPGRAKFRTWLLASLNHYLHDQYDRRTAAKRGGGKSAISIDVQDAEHRYQLEPHHDETPDKLYDRQWIATLVNEAQRRLERDYRKSGKGTLYQHLCAFLVEGAEPEPYAVIAARLGMTEAATRKAVHRLRQNFRWAVREEIAQTVANRADLAEEFRILREILST